MQANMHTNVSYGVKYQARCITAVRADTHRTRFLVGTLSLREENEVHVIQLSDNGADLRCEGLYTHQPEIWDLASCPFDALMISTVYASGGEYRASIWKIPERSKGFNTPQLQQIVQLDGHKDIVKSTLWWPTGKHNQLVSIDEENLYVWALDASEKSAKVQGHISAGRLQTMSAGCWDPHDVTSVATACGSSIKCWDLRSMKQANTIEQAHAVQVRDIDYNPNVPDIMVSAGDDSKIRVWDLRNSGMPLLELPGHSHWTWRVRYNPKYQELVLSAGTDSVVNLWHVSTPSSTEDKLRSTSGSPRSPLDPLLRSHHEHEDSVYGVAWSSYDPWIFASLSYDGRVLIDSVPHAIRKKLSQGASK
ncbi:hypothetical protein O6H91_08G007500 [Diphasiastrum complanatum]|uniref:Uncharacterized protein n=4 Tax=Diphasiastrum complanatum TaxID=34168 RepID=A0ACC2CUS0_DIPCM|nr:hypothetical protein O6H91_08G007500 [Diphasiastrum complanatum]KAJ7545732.1 hypothetical protein O6H91_08G007500 [Diphasiastrum complanatum]KAJ7545733.1 hypothetical protein O6H91_08G007500 [Diphasiastrum complanatum]KAJ7545735.1 hypothetical protein O6H91_08G007500 [Diphasiastrum complanatum]